MKKIILVLSVIFGLTSLNAQTIHWITFIDTTDAYVGNIDKTGRDVLYSHIINQVNAALAQKGYKSDVHDFYGNSMNPENCKSIVQNLKISDPDDIIVFYYIGHGGRPKNEDVNYMKAHPFPQMCLGLPLEYEYKYIPLEWIDNQLKNKGARLAVTIGMCCNSEGSISKKEGPKFSVTYGPTYMSGNKIEKIQNLFLGEKGSVIATSSSPTQTSSGAETVLGEMDAYTAMLAFIFDDMDDASIPVYVYNWDNVLNSLSEQIDTWSSSNQTPFHRSNLTVATQPSQENKRADVPQPESVKREAKEDKTEGNSETRNELNNIFAALIDTKISPEDRITLEKIVGLLFTPEAQVRFLGQDGNTVIDREDIDVFLGRLATSRLLLNVAVDEITLNNQGEITSLKVREIYKK